MGTRLVSVLGLGPSPTEPHYTPTSYAVSATLGDAQRSAPTPLIQAALLELDPTISSVVLLGTAAVRARWVTTGLARRLLGREFHFVDLPDGASSEERWEIFHRIARALRSDRIDGIEDVEPDQIVFDITHGFRLQLKELLP